MTLWLALAFMALCAGAFVALPFIAPLRAQAEGEDAAAALNAELAAIEAGEQAGELNAEGARAARIDAERRALKAPKPAHVWLSGADGKRAGLAAGACAAAALAFYAVTGHPNLPGAPAPPPSPAQAQLAQLTATLQQRVHEAPGDADGWRALGWALFMGARYQEAGEAYARAVALRPESAAFRSAYGEALVGAAQGVVTPQAAAAFGAALKQDARDVRSRFYLGLQRAQAGDPQAAIAAWLKLYREAPPGGEAAQDLRRRIDALAAEAKIDVSAALPPEKPAAAPASDEAAQLSDRERDAMIDAMVASLDRRLSAHPHDLEGWTRLVHARVVQGKMAAAGAALARARAAFAGDAGAQAQLDAVAAEAGLHE